MIVAATRPRRHRWAVIGRALVIGTVVAGIPACGIGGVGQRQPVQCTADSARTPVVTLVKEKLEHSIDRSMSATDGARPVSLSEIRAAIAQLVIDIDDIRTSKEDPNSAKRFCTGTLRIRFPADTLADADRAREATNLNSVSDLADNNDVERHADSFTTTIEFNVQPTDDGSKVFAETESGNNMFSFAAELLSSSLLRTAVEDRQRQQQNAADQATAAQNAALVEQRNANEASARTENQLATQAIDAVWRALTPGQRRGVVQLQRDWIRKKSADCAVEAASASLDPTERETARLQCDTRVTNERIGFLNTLRAQQPPPPADAGFDAEGANSMCGPEDAGKGRNC